MMKALVLTAPSTFEYRDVPTPVPGEDEVLVRVGAAAICGSDVHGMDGSSGRRIPPLIMGHEGAGTIEACGSRVSGWAVGDRVTFDSTVYCGTCRFCRAGRVNLCDNRRVLGVSCAEYRRDGAFAEYLTVPEQVLYRVPEAVSDVQAALTEPLSIALHAVGRAPLRVDDAAVVVGAGNIGLLVVQLLRVAGAGLIVAIDPEPGRRAAAVSLGADQAFDGGPEALDRVADLTGGAGADVTFEVVGTSASLGTAVGCLRKGGNAVLVGNIRPTVEFALQSVVTREIGLYASCASAGEYPVCLDLMQRGKVDVMALVSAVEPLEHGAEWFRRLSKGGSGLLKVVLRPAG